MENHVFGQFTWTIEKFSKKLKNSKKLHSETFVIGGYPRRILIFPNGNDVECLSIYLVAANTANLPKGWSRDGRLRITPVNQVNRDCSITKGREYLLFNARVDDSGFGYFTLLANIHDPCMGFLVKDTCIIAIEVFVPESRDENQVEQAASITVSPVSKQVCTEPIEHNNKEMPSNSIGNLMDFRGLGKIEKDFVTLLEELCSQHPSLIECQQNRTLRFTKWAFTALGKVLHFLKTERVKDMNEDSCKHLENDMGGT